MAIKYSQKIFKKRKEFINLIGPETKTESEVHSNIFDAWKTKTIKWKDSDVWWSDMYLQYAFAFYPITHFFLGHGIFDFCINSFKPIPIPEDFSYPKIGEDINLNLDSRIFFNSKIAGQNQAELIQGSAPSVGVIHFPLKENRRSILFSLNVITPYNRPHAPIVRRAFIATDTVDCASVCHDAWGKDLGDATSIVNFLFGFILYLKAFPECVKPATREDVKSKEPMAGSQKILIGKNKIVENELKLSVSPHWRRGHFRVLSSDRFVKKKGKTVFVKGSFVKGKALDVE